jgi:hypothetical protein
MPRCESSPHVPLYWTESRLSVIARTQLVFPIIPEACYTPAPTVAALTTRSLFSMAVLLAFGAYVMRKRRYA